VLRGLSFLLVMAGCSPAVAPDSPPASTPTVTTSESRPSTTAAAASTAASTVPPSTTAASLFARPAWLGTRLLPLRPDEFGEVQPTPPELVDRQLETLDLLPPSAGTEFEWTINPIPLDVLARSSWSDECPVTVEELSYLTLSHIGFDGRLHTGEMIVNRAVAEDVVEVFRQLHAAQFPIEQMRVITAAEIDAHPTGDWNDTTSFVCRPAVGATSWSQHAYGTAIDVNPFHNPYQKADLVLPELASAYTDRANLRTGMIAPGDVVTAAFDQIGWTWGGNWRNLKDWMHFSLSGG